MKSFISGEFVFRNYVDCSLDEHQQILRWRNDSDIRKWMANDSLIDELDHRKFVNSLESDRTKAYFAVFKSDDYIASVYLTDIKGNQGERGLYVIPSFQGKGTTQIIELIFLKYLRDNGIKYVNAKVKINNLRSIRYHIKMGYKETFRDDCYIHFKLDTEMITNINRGGIKLMN